MQLDEYQRNEFDTHWAGCLVTKADDDGVYIVDGMSGRSPYPTDTNPNKKAGVHIQKLIGGDRLVNDPELSCIFDLEPYHPQYGYFNMGGGCLRISKYPLQSTKRGLTRRSLSATILRYHVDGRQLGWSNFGIPTDRHFLDIMFKAHTATYPKKEEALQTVKDGRLNVALSREIALCYAGAGRMPCLVYDTCAVGFVRKNGEVLIHDSRSMFRKCVEEVIGEVTIYG